MNTKIQSLKVIENAKINNVFSHAYLFFGEQGVDVFSIALEAIKIIICDEDKCMKAETIEELNYPDLLFVNPENNLITKESIVSTIKIMSNTSLVSNKKKILLIKDIDLGNKYSLNSLLKYIEDPSKNTHIIMTTNKIDFLLPTIKSRAQNIVVRRQTTDQIIEDLLINKINDNYIRLFANIFPNATQAKELNAKVFDKTYLDVLSALNTGIDNSQKMKMELTNSITKENILYAINILEYFYYQIQTNIDKKYPLFPDYNKLINKYKKSEIDYSIIQIAISIWKKSFINKGNFNLQKENFLIKLVSIYER